MDSCGFGTSQAGKSVQVDDSPWELHIYHRRPTSLEVWSRPAGIPRAIPCGIDRVRFIGPVPVDARVRNRIKLLAIESKAAGRPVTTENIIEMEHQDKPALVANVLTFAMSEWQLLGDQRPS